MLVSAAELRDWLAAEDCLVFDCRSDLKDPDAGRRAWLAGHLPGAVHASLYLDLAGPVGPQTGRHPLPEATAFAGFLARSGWSRERRVAAYDAQGGAYAVRLWWLMRHFGLPVPSLLDGGWQAWLAAGYETHSGEVIVRASPTPRLHAAAADALPVDAVQAGLAAGSVLLLDARGAERFAGLVEPIDPVAGHVPGAVNRPYTNNLDAQGFFKSPEVLAGEFAARLGETAPGDVVHMCGSGVTACHNLFAMELAGLADSRLYPGSWSEWIRDPARPVATGTA